MRLSQFYALWRSPLPWRCRPGCRTAGRRRRTRRDSFADLAAQLLPSVVNVSSSQRVQASADRGPEIPGFPPGSPFEQFFHDFLDRNRPPGQRRAEPQSPDRQWRRPAPGAGRAVSLGSGFIIDPAGYIVTNNHVIDGADEISVTLTDNTTLKAKLVGKDERVDLALLKVDTDHPLKAVEFGDSDARARGRLGAGDRQPVRPRRLGDRRHRQRPRPRHPPGPV